MTEAPQLVPAAVDLQKPEAMPTDEQAKAALKAIGSSASMEAIEAYQTLGSWSTKLSAAKMTMAVGLTDLGESNNALKHAQRLIEVGEAEGDNDMVVNGLKMQATFMAERRMLLQGMMSAEKHTREAAAVVRGKNAPPSIHQHVHLHGKQPQPATP